MPKPTLTPREYIFKVAVDPDFRNKYLTKPEALKANYDISDADFKGIEKIDGAKLGAELDKIKAGVGMRAGGIITGVHTNNSHESHCKGGDPHCKDSHNNGRSVMVPRDFEKVILSSDIANRITNVTRGRGRIIR